MIKWDGKSENVHLLWALVVQRGKKEINIIRQRMNVHYYNMCIGTRGPLAHKTREKKTGKGRLSK